MVKTPNLKTEKFLSKIHDIYHDKYFDIEKYFYINKPVTFRINRLKLNSISSEQIIENLKNQGFEVTSGPVKDSYICNSGKTEIKLSETEEVLKGLIYIQKLSSMLPAIYMNLKPGQNILDMCASPGSKTSQIAADLNNNCFITAVENNKKRFYILKKNLETLGVNCVKAIYENSVTLPLKYPNLMESFDRVLLDLPCSNEGYVNLENQKSLDKWNYKTAERLSKLQKTLLYSGVSMLKPGGLLLYSTCTYSVEENEVVIDWALKKFGNLNIQEIEVGLKNALQGFTKWNNVNFDDRLTKTTRILPTELFSGFYFALLKKTIG
ncbi:hypothetical protein A3F07_00560 [candidate division WWE3 bacterium RIFCSPHIGHO2_12_FULL_38_15]|uniref:SAM-dependent MTase RsmB/NOP-type domain-containing protein n=1 Tax=candidate division WWE3 bacterium RIFCSPHIGHO2_02_FULL_38_14 TaxID=1802620 RepID=A0A1F4VB41_UNCKA|nr:MAG: hypothetical protein A2793_00645 [candidate division WWE3 bacterium RIFCSPHIGHO2_01_FULL_38_45]OGC49066.1 MAG: hypothetical protein A3F07_00560 [candidate division WWE3 bacterium RIFCSPHIGHO2_12_FULL_38_15]OGC53521.1 MAG: hypothetical protein A3B64_04195 [candidate division WWE3 bacterium RIFCSPLOWO2_01_FULL_37_24]OGC54425.1 MAG: hypothetical protein A3D91_00825 [candidate division WWE3 bacterium RIFCSPHIGHO2_02_FULL_38_14]HLB51670.1 RsmB/NOP family class I SAM-dependent RNA methyltrans